MSFTSHLYQLPTSHLREIIRRRSRSLRSIPRLDDKRKLCEFLAEALSTPASINEALGQTNRLQIQALTFAIVQGGTTTFDALTAQLGEDSRERLWAAVSELELTALAILQPIKQTEDRLGSSYSIFVPPAVRANVPLPPSMLHNLPNALERYDAAVIGAIYQTLEMPLAEAGTKAARVARITQMLTDPKSVREALTGLSDAAKKTLLYVVEIGGAATLSELAQRLDSRQRNQLYSYDWAMRWYHGKPRNPVEELLARGILIMDGSVGWGYGQILIPGNVLTAITGRSIFSDGAVPKPEWQVKAADSASLHRHDSLCRDIAYLMGYVGRNEAPRTNKGVIHRTVLKNLSKGLTNPTPDYASFVYAIARECDLIEAQGRQGIYDVTEQGLAWLELTSAEQLKSLYDIWRVQTAWAEIAEDPLTEGTAFYHADETRACRECAIALMRDLCSEHGDELASLDSLARRAEYQWWRRFPVAHPQPRDSQVDEEFDEEVSLAYVLLSLILGGSMYWLGLTEVEVDSRGIARYVRLSQRGITAFLGESDDATERTSSDTEAVETFIVQPNLEIYTPPNLSPRVLYRLFKIAEPSSRAGSLLVLSKETLRKAFDRGETAEGILKLFRENSQLTIPQNVEYLINEVGGKHGHIHIGQAGIYIQVSDPLLLQEIEAQKKLNVRFRRKLTDTVALVTGESVDAILKQLRSAGYLPVSDEDKPAAGTSAPQAPKRIYKAPVNSRGLAKDLSSKVDWQAIEASVTDLFSVEKSEQAKNVSFHAPDDIRSLIMQTMDAKEAVAIRYQPDPNVPDAERVIEPISISGNLLRAHDRSKGSNVLFNLRYVTSARFFDGTRI